MIMFKILNLQNNNKLEQWNKSCEVMRGLQSTHLIKVQGTQGIYNSAIYSVKLKLINY